MDKENLEKLGLSDYDSYLEISIESLKNFLIRNKKKIITISSLSLALVGIYGAFIKDKIWQGQIQVVLNNKKNSFIDSNANILLEANPNLSEIPGLGLGGEGKSDIKTEVEILKSPSVLMPIFDYVKENKKSKGIKVSKWRYKDWFRDNLSVNIIKQTSVLNVSYKDTDKELILPVLNKISQKYKLYSNKDRNKSINSGIEYLNDQINIYKKLGFDSRQKLMNFSSENDIFARSFSTKEGVISIPTIEKVRIDALDKIRVVNENIKVINRPEIKEETLTQLASIILMDGEKKVPNSDLTNLDKINTELSKLRTIYTKKSKIIKNKEFEKKIYINSLKETLKNSLNAKKISLQAIINASTKSPSILFEYSELLRKNNINEATLDKLNKDLRMLKLDRELIQEPWELITNPTLLDEPISPKISSFLMIGLLGGFLIACVYSFYLERKLGIIFDKRVILNILYKNEFDFFDLSIYKIDRLEESIKLFLKSLDNNNEAVLVLKKLGDNNYEKIEIVENILQKNIKANNLIFKDSLSNLNENDNLVILLSPERIKFDEIYTTIENIKLTKIKSLKWLVV